MSGVEHEQARTLAEIDQAEREAVAEAEQAILRVYEEMQPASLPALFQALEQPGVAVTDDRSLLRLALLGLLNSGRLSFADDERLAAAGER
jgi:hypothetical protein